ncbi:hypothetical protein ONE63_001070 [Megalurothrips usitatus]|uniref:Retrotransposon gag domain-containing protein n=1 Tax=Megalurothrips usitatus TaxID=439358 RepID=A0AAV7XEZ6_9NEOP|nr:hypothetical protein ONE63_001070 [Megalurothrips usitatus]
MSRRGGFLGSPPHSPPPPPSERDSTEDERAQPHFRAGFHMNSLDGFGTPPFMRHTQAPPAGPHAPRLQLPTLRDGGDVRDFLLKFERRVDFYRCTDREKILHLEDCIQHRAISAWLTQFLKNRGNASYQTVENALTAAFCPPEDDRHLREAMVARRKQDGETVNTYFMDKVVLINKFSPDMKAHEQISYIREGLPPNLQVKLAGQKFDGITHLRDYLVTLEADIQELQRTKILSADLFATPSPVKTVTVQEPPAAPVAAEGIAALQLEAKLDSLIAAIGSMWSHEKHSSDDRRKRDDTPYRQRSRGSSWERRGSYSRSRDRSQDRSRDRSRDRSWGRDSRRDSRDRDSRRDSRDRDYRRSQWKLWQYQAMPFAWDGKICRLFPDEERLVAAVSNDHFIPLEGIQDGMNARTAAKAKGLSHGTLQRHIQKHKDVDDLQKAELSPTYSHRQVFTQELEEKLVGNILERSKLGYGLTALDT